MSFAAGVLAGVLFDGPFDFAQGGPGSKGRRARRPRDTRPRHEHASLGSVGQGGAAAQEEAGAAGSRWPPASSQRPQSTLARHAEPTI